MGNLPGAIIGGLVGAGGSALAAHQAGKSVGESFTAGINGAAVGIVVGSGASAIVGLLGGGPTAMALANSAGSFAGGYTKGFSQDIAGLNYFSGYATNPLANSTNPANVGYKVNDAWGKYMADMARKGWNCFPANTPILLSDGSTKPIEDICPGDVVMAFDGDAQGGRGALVPKMVTRLFANVTQEWLVRNCYDGNTR